MRQRQWKKLSLYAIAVCEVLVLGCLPDASVKSTLSSCANTVHKTLGLNTGRAAARCRSGGSIEAKAEVEEGTWWRDASDKMRFSWWGRAWVMQVSARKHMSRDFRAKKSWASSAGASEMREISCATGSEVGHIITECGARSTGNRAQLLQCTLSTPTCLSLFDMVSKLANPASARYEQ